MANVVSILALTPASRQDGPSLSTLLATIADKSTRLFGAHPGPSGERSQRHSSKQLPSARLPVAGQRPRHTLETQDMADDEVWERGGSRGGFRGHTKRFELPSLVWDKDQVVPEKETKADKKKKHSLHAVDR